MPIIVAMCARITLFSPSETLAAVFHLDSVPTLQPRYNIAPTQPLAAVRLDPEGKRQCVPLRWGLIPAWARDASIGQKMINARSETVSDKPAYRAAFARRRCLVAVDGFYEWQTVKGKKQPIHFRRCDSQPFAFAGLWEHWAAPGGEPIESCTVLTTAANELLSAFHDRMPVLIAPKDHDLWLDSQINGGERLQALLRPAPAEEMMAVPANVLVNNPRNEGPECLIPSNSPIRGLFEEPTLTQSGLRTKSARNTG